MNNTLKIVINKCSVMKIIMNVIYHLGIDFVGLFEDLWKKI